MRGTTQRRLQGHLLLDSTIVLIQLPESSSPLWRPWDQAVISVYSSTCCAPAARQAGYCYAVTAMERWWRCTSTVFRGRIFGAKQAAWRSERTPSPTKGAFHINNQKCWIISFLNSQGVRNILCNLRYFDSGYVLWACLEIRGIH